MDAELSIAAKAATVHSRAMTHRLYVIASGFLNMVLAAAGKDSDADVEFRTLRIWVDRPPREIEVPESVEVVKSEPGVARLWWNETVQAGRVRSHLTLISQRGLTASLKSLSD